MKLYGLTGGIGMGKSAAARILAERGIPIVDTDVLARDIVEPGQPALNEIRAAFGDRILDAAGRLQRGELAKIVFADPAARQTLQAITHPRIRAVWKQQSEQWRAGGKPLGVVVIPLLFETQAELEFTDTLCVACSSATQLRRLQERGWTLEQIGQRLAAQWPVEKKIAKSNHVIWNEAGLDALAAQLEKVIPAES